MKKVFVISICLGKKGNLFLFHFRGFYHGVKIEQILVSGGDFAKDKAYLLALCDIEIHHNILVGKCLKAKELTN